MSCVQIDGLDGDDLEGFIREIDRWRDLLQDSLDVALTNPSSPFRRGIAPADEAKAIKLAKNQLSKIDEMVKIVRTHVPYRHEQIYAVECLWQIITSAFIIGSHTNLSDAQHKFRQSQAGQRPRKKSQKDLRLDALLAEATDAGKNHMQYVRKNWDKKIDGLDENIDEPDDTTIRRHLRRMKNG